jgi:hypothetical protein
MTQVPKIVYDRLRAALPGRTGTELAHPDADLLTAFAEQALSAVERDGVLEHLARCGYCRETVALALPAMESMAAPVAEDASKVGTMISRQRPQPKRIFAWPTLRWAALAAGVVVVASVLLLRPGKLNQPQPPSANQQVAVNVPPVPAPQIASPSLPPPTAAASIGQPAAATRADEIRSKPELGLSKKLKAGQVAAPPPSAESGMLLAENKIAANPKDSRGPDNGPGASAGARVLDYSAGAIPRTNETVTVAAASPVVQTEVSTEALPVPQNGDRPIAKAKPAPQTETSQLQGTISSSIRELPVQGRNVVSMAQLAPPQSPTGAQAVTWAITAGALQRSLDNGQSWQDVLRPDHPLLCYASHDADIWAGGQAGTLFHSTDNGVTWVLVKPSSKGRQLSSDVTHIDVHRDLHKEIGANMRGGVSNLAEIVVSTSDNETWSSADGGKTWGQKVTLPQQPK